MAQKNEVTIKLFGKIIKEILVVSIKEIVFQHIFYKSMHIGIPYWWIQNAGVLFISSNFRLLTMVIFSIFCPEVQ